MGSTVRCGVQAAELRIQDIVSRGRERVRRGRIAVQEFVTVDDLQNTASVCPIPELHPISDPDWPMQRRWNWLP